MNIKKLIIFMFFTSFVFMFYSTLAISGEKVYHSKIKSINPEMVDGQYCMLKLLLKKLMIQLLKKKFWSVLTVETNSTVQVIGRCLPNFTTEMSIRQNIACLIQGLAMLLSRSEKYV